MINKIVHLDFTIGIRTALADGTLVHHSPQHMATEFLYLAETGGKLTINLDEYLFAVALYRPQIEEQYLYTYCYQPESNWTLYEQNLTPDSYSDSEYQFKDKCYFRVCVRRKDGSCITEEDVLAVQNNFEYRAVEVEYQPPYWLTTEIQKTVNKAKILESNKENKLIFALLSDSHYTVNGTWKDTAYSLKELQKGVLLDGIIHLGDLTDGIMSKKVTSTYAAKVISDLQAGQAPVYVTIGNHDVNYFMNNKDIFSKEELIEVYDTGVKKRKNTYYSINIKANIWCLFLTSFDADRPIRYGFGEDELQWVRDTLSSLPIGSKVIVFSHDAPFAVLDYWSYYVWNGDDLISILEEYNAEEGQHILAYFHGHAHGDYIYEKCSFPVISIGCAKCECFFDMKPQGFSVPIRKLGDSSQELWDIAVFNLDENWLNLVRFGAGNDRSVDCNKRDIERNKNEKHKRTNHPKIWAHRGVSGYAPENTLPSFELAVKMKLDGVELDVQMTKDEELVVIHDEQIDRVSNGKGYVKDYNLEELKVFNYAKNFPSYGFISIPTLREVLELLKKSNLTINLELKNNTILYQNMEVKVLKLVEDMKLEERVIYSSFNHYSLYKIKEINSKAKIAALCSDLWMDMPRYIKKYSLSGIHPCIRHPWLDELVKECKKVGVGINVWTVDAEEDIQKAINADVNAIITNYPDKVLKLIKYY